MENYSVVIIILAIMIGLSAIADVVVLFTLIGQGLSLPWLVKKLKPHKP